MHLLNQVTEVCIEEFVNIMPNMTDTMVEISVGGNVNYEMPTASSSEITLRRRIYGGRFFSV